MHHTSRVYNGWYPREEGIWWLKPHIRLDVYMYQANHLSWMSKKGVLNHRAKGGFVRSLNPRLLDFTLAYLMRGNAT